MAEIKVLPNGPYLVTGDDVVLKDAQDNIFVPPRTPYALCRCGGSESKPFCDGTHSKIGFIGASLAVAIADRSEP